ncbi:MAG: hypothetical protein EXR91_03730 [Gemmatimonadetes bacterium]|nr:hypothetical protein [Gemmatimonadota bacterium]
MKGNWIRFAGGLLTVAAVSMAGSAQVSAQTVNVAGAWTMSVTTEAGGTTTPSMTIVQTGTALTGHYVSTTLGEADITGTVEGSRVTISFTADLQGQAAPVVYAATVGADGVMTGTIDIAGGLASGTFTAKRAGE